MHKPVSPPISLRARRSPRLADNGPFLLVRLQNKAGGFLRPTADGAVSAAAAAAARAAASPVARTNSCLLAAPGGCKNNPESSGRQTRICSGEGGGSVAACAAASGGGGDVIGGSGKRAVAARAELIGAGRVTSGLNTKPEGLGIAGVGDDQWILLQEVTNFLTREPNCRRTHNPRRIAST